MIPENLTKAILREISWDSNQNPVDGNHSVEVQFNPESLKLALSNQNASGDQRGGSAIQYVGAGTSKLSFDLWFDTTGSPGQDVRDLTNKVIFFMTPKASGQEGKFIPPGVRFLWGTFLFEGIMDSLNEDLEYFSEDGRPLRAKLSISMSRQEIRFEEGSQQGGSGLGTTAASGGKQQAQDGDTVPDLAGDDWPAVAAANGIENPLDLAPGALLDLNPAASLNLGLSAGASLGAGLSAGASFSAGFSAGASLGGGLRAGVAGGANLGAGIGGGLSASAGAGIGGGIGAGASLGGGFNAGASLSGGFSAGSGLGGGVNSGASLGGGVGAGIGLSGGVSAGASAGASFGGAAASASAAANASFDRKLRR